MTQIVVSCKNPRFEVAQGADYKLVAMLSERSLVVFDSIQCCGPLNRNKISTQMNLEVITSKLSDVFSCFQQSEKSVKHDPSDELTHSRKASLHSNNNSPLLTRGTSLAPEKRTSTVIEGDPLYGE